jgi:hypothetical protein
MEVVVAEFKGWPSISRLAREVVVTEKIDGTNGAIHIERLKFDTTGTLEVRAGDVIDFDNGDMTFMRLTAQSRTRLISPKDDNHGFAKWVADNAAGLAAELGEGIHYGEWWGYKINRGYGLAKGDKRFSLFNTERWAHLDGSQIPGLHCVPVLAMGHLFDPEMAGDQDIDLMEVILNPVTEAVAKLRDCGSVAAPGYDRPEGIVVFHTAGRVMFKYTLDDDGHKSAAKPDPFADVRRPVQPLMTREEQERIWDEEEAAMDQVALDKYKAGVLDSPAPVSATWNESQPLWEGLVQ